MYDYFKVEVQEGPTAEEIKAQKEEKEAKIRAQIEEEDEERRRLEKKAKRFDPKVEKIKQMERKV